MASAQGSPYEASIKRNKDYKISPIIVDLFFLSLPFKHRETSVEKVKPAGHVQKPPKATEHVDSFTTDSQSE